MAADLLSLERACPLRCIFDNKAQTLRQTADLPARLQPMRGQPLATLKLGELSSRSPEL